MPEVLQLSEHWNKNLFVSLDGTPYPVDEKQIKEIIRKCSDDVLGNELFYAIVVSEKGDKQEKIRLPNRTAEELFKYLEIVEEAYI